MTTVSIIIPAYNEEKTIIQVLKQVQAQQSDTVSLEVIVVDDGSTDGTAKLIEANRKLVAHYIRQPQNRGKGAAVKAGLQAATGDFVLFQDADLEYNPVDYGKMFKPLQLFDADVVMGSRMVAPEYTRVSYFWHKLGNRTITFIFNIINNTTFTDIYSCYLLFRRRLVNPDELQTEGWEQHAEILSLAVARGEKLYEVPISYHGRTYAEGKKIKAYHAAAIIWTILKRRILR
jgi:glycosyltransferase involved in cell wall biosynthesis